MLIVFCTLGNLQFDIESIDVLTIRKTYDRNLIKAF